MLSTSTRRPPAPPSARSSLEHSELDPWADQDSGSEGSEPETVVARGVPAALDLDPALDPPDPAPAPAPEPAPRRVPSNIKLRGSPRQASAAAFSPRISSALRTPASPAASAPGALGKGVPRATSHPLALDELALGLRNGTLDGKIASLRLEEGGDDSDDVSDVSRPNLRRLTSEMDRAVAESQGSSASASERGSVDVLRVAKEVEVIVHQLATLRKANKMWPSDPLHLRTHLYVPLDACRPTAKGDAIVREGGQVRLVPRRASGANGESSTNGEGSSSGDAAATAAVVLDIVRLPASQLRFFPHQQRGEASRSHRSLDSEVGRSADSVRAMSASERAARRQRARTHTGHFVPDDPLPPARGSKRVVRLRPPRELTPEIAEPSLARRLSMLFSVAPPPAHPPPLPPQLRQGSPRGPGPGSVPTSGASTPAYPAPAPAVELEMDARAVPRRTDVRPEDLVRMAASGGHIKPTRRPTDKKRD
ncbi:hypothetical protein Q8F55_008741 [Vanrija albida]|uniref:LysM domain-containing protein n=1 Tax=Vanrija albida TaxID=181172 RepID=A0ABR3PRP6_9TREE